MPTYEHLCTDTNCNHEWEDFYSIKAEPPTTCPKCNKETAKRLISGGSGRGVVELGGNELVEKVKSDAQALKREAAASEKVYANLLGEQKYQDLQTRMDRQKRG